MKKTILTICLSVIAVGFCSASLVWAKEQPIAEKKPLIQMAILLDTSSSMEGLIDQARAELWAIVNEFILAKKNGIAPQFELALYEYGKDSIAQDKGYIRMIVPFTTDLDKVSEELFALTTNGGSEYCGWVIQEAVKSLQWSNSPDELKVIFIAGNEPFTQGPIDYHEVCKTAISKGIVVNTIHCGPENEGINTNWKDGAVLADGQYLNIDQNRKTVHIDAPQDTEIADLGLKLNDTYIAFGSKGAASSKRQSEQDLNAAVASQEATLQRAVSKSSLYYQNAGWDLVDASKDNKFDIKDVNTQDLPENMQKMTVDERKVYVETKAKQRSEIQQKIQQLNDQRKIYVADEMKKQNNNTDSLGSAIIQAVSEQAKKKNFKIESPQPSPKKEG